MTKHRAENSCRCSSPNTRWALDMRRQGISLIELILALSLGSTVMVLAVTLVHRTLTHVSIAAERFDHQTAMNRLVQSFRSDVHRATDAQLSSPNLLRLRMPDDVVVTYRCQSGVVRRSEPLSDDRERRESFAFLAQTEVVFERLASPERIAFSATRKGLLKESQSIVDRRVQGVIGRRRFLENGVVIQ